MPTTLPGSFASAAAAAASTDSSARSSSRGDSSVFAEWPRRTNGATQTFRRTSAATTATLSSTTSSSQREQPPNLASAGAYVPPHISTSRGVSSIDTRYSKSQLLHLFRLQKDVGDLDESLATLYVGDSPFDLSNGGSASKWSRKEDQKPDYNTPGPDICWERAGASEPLALIDMTDEEKELFSTSVNSPLKAPNQSGSNRESVQREGGVSGGGRKGSVSQSQAGSHSYGSSFTTASKSGTRRRDTSDSYSYSKDSAITPISPPSAKDDIQDPMSPPFGIIRRKTDAAETPLERSIDEELGRDAGESSLAAMPSPFGSTKRSPSNLANTSFTETASNWASASPTSGSANLPSAFGNLGRTGSNLASNSKRMDPTPSRESRFRGLMNIGRTEEEPSEGFDNTSARALRQDPISSTDLSQEMLAGESGSRLASRHGLSEMSSSQSLAEEAGVQGSSSLGGFSEQFYRDSNLTLQQQSTVTSNEPLSPTFTNPYASPQQQNPSLHDIASDDFDPGNLHLPGLGSYQARPPHDGPAPTSFAARREMSRNMSSYDQRSLDRSQLLGSNPASSKGFPPLSGLGGLGNLGGPESWSAGFGLPQSAREKSSFPDFGAQSTGIPGSPGGAAFGDPGAIGRTSKLGSLFPSAMQDQMRGEQGRSQRDESNLQAGSEASEDLARVVSARRDMDSPFRQGRGKFDDFPGSPDVGQAFRGSEPPMLGEQPASSSAQASQPQSYNLPQQQYSSQHQTQRGTSISTPTSSQPPAAQQKTMVMPDRIRWIYRDPQGNTQGPWSGLEMHDWYRAGFFSPELLVKKVEDGDYEPLAQLIRRIGNSREPFLVPQIGIPGPPSSQQGPGWPNQNVVSSPQNPSATVQPPFAGSFPSFGTTLTAEQQNALERRKQEEQYLMARQKEHLAQQQLHARQMQTQHGYYPQQLQHHASAQSLQSQPSYGSMTSPNGFQTSPPQNASNLNPNTHASAFDSPFRLGGGVGIGPIGSGMDSRSQIRDEAPGYFGAFGAEQGSTDPSSGHYAMDQQFKDLSLEERTAAMLADRARLERQQIETERLAELRSSEEREPLLNERLAEFQEMRSSMQDEEGSQSQSLGFQEDLTSQDEAMMSVREPAAVTRPLSLTEQVQKAASSRQSPTASPWAKVDASVVESIVPHSASPLPAPAARRGPSNVADTLAAESITQSESPAEETPTASIAPWAKESVETTKQPSLREIQELEARKAAKQEEIAAAARRAALEREIASQSQPPAPGLPSTSTWGSAESPSGSASSAWSKPTAISTAAPSTALAKKTLQQIQAEEEAAARKKKASAVSNASIASHIAGQVQSMSSGKRYADLAGKAALASPGTTPTGGAWTTVGASGKAKTPITTQAATPSTTATVTTRSSSGTNLVGTAASASAAVRPKPTTSNSKQSLATAKQTAMEELKKWATSELQPDLHKNINVDEFVSTLFSFPVDTEIITEVVHQNSTTIDSRHFAEEFTRRRNLAEKGKMDTSGSTSATSTASLLMQGGGGDGKGSSGGWNEVARKGGATTSANSNEGNGAFKIVTAKKKGKR